MWSRIRQTLYAGALSCVLHILLLGIAAAVVITLPYQPSPHLRVTLLQRAIPFPAQEQPKGEEKLHPAPPLVLAEENQLPKPIVRRKPTPKALARPLKRSNPLPRILVPKPPPTVHEEPSVAAVAPAPPPVASKKEPEVSPMSEELISSTGEERTPETYSDKDGLGGSTDQGGRVSRNGGRDEGVNGLSAVPDYQVNPKPPYPLIARRIGAQGEVLLRVLVRQDGSVAAVELAQSSGFSLLDESATRTVRENWRFIPAQHDGIPVESWVEVPIRFVLADS
jgi:protein TonB